MTTALTFSPRLRCASARQAAEKGQRFGSLATLRNSINFSNGAEAWTDMNAQPQSIRRHYGKKTTEIQIGVARHLNSGQLSALLNMWRYRRTWYNPLLRTQNDLGESGDVDQAIDTGNANTPQGLQDSCSNGIFSYTTPPNVVFIK